MNRVATSLLVTAVLALTLAGSGPSRPAGHVVETGFRSVGIGGKLRLAVYLPPGYESSHLRYPVVYFLHELPAYVDGHFRTLRDRRARAIVGLSAGGYGAVLVAFHHLDRFSCRTCSTSIRAAISRPCGPRTLASGSSSRSIICQRRSSARN